MLTSVPSPRHEMAHEIPHITGSTRVYFIVGHPVEQVRAPEAFNLIFARFGIDAVLVPIAIAPEHLSGFVQSVFNAPNVGGLWVTIPHKTPLLGLLQDATPLARAAGAVNAVRRNADGTLSGALFDGIGFTKGLDHAGIGYDGRRALVVGAGGAAAAIGASLASGSHACAAVDFYDPAPGKAAGLVAHLQRYSSAPLASVGASDPAGYGLVINASPLGLRAGDPLPFDVQRVYAGAAVVDILMKNQPTPLVRAAWARGLTAQPGFEMMIQQAALYLEFFGYHGAAKAVQADADFLRRAVYPAALLGESPRNPTRPIEAAA